MFLTEGSPSSFERPQRTFFSQSLEIYWLLKQRGLFNLHYPVSLTNGWRVVNMYKRKTSLLLASKPGHVLCCWQQCIAVRCSKELVGISLYNSWACASNSLGSCENSAHPCLKSKANSIQGCSEIFGVGVSNTFILLSTRTIFLHSNIQPDVFYSLICHNCLYIIYKL